MFLFAEENIRRSLCNTTATNIRRSTTNLIFDAADVAVGTMTNICSCNITGHFKLKNKDIRIQRFDTNSCPSVSATGCKDGNCITKETNCSKWHSVDIWISQNVKNGYISLTGLSSLKPPSFIWIQIVNRCEYPTCPGTCYLTIDIIEYTCINAAEW